MLQSRPHTASCSNALLHGSGWAAYSGQTSRRAQQRHCWGSPSAAYTAQIQVGDGAYYS